MYFEYYGLQDDPFRLAPDGRPCYEHESYRQVLTSLKYALHKQEGVALVTGDPGLGKTSLIIDLAGRLSKSRIRTIRLTCSQNSADDLVALLARVLSLNPAGKSKSENLFAIEQELMHLRQQLGLYTVLVMDEAQTLGNEALEQVRLLTNLHMQDKALVQIFLVGQRSLHDMVLSSELEQLHQRIIVSASLAPLDEMEIKGYITHRLNLVGWKNHPQLADHVFPLVHFFSAGIPRWINLILSRLLLHGMGENKEYLGIDELDLVVADMLNEGLLPIHVRSQLSAQASDIRASYG